MFVVECNVLHFKAHWRSGSTQLQKPEAHENAVASPKVYEFFDDILK